MKAIKNALRVATEWVQERRERAHQDRARGRNGPRRGARGRPRMKRAKIVGVGAYAPKRVLTNAELEKMVETSDEWIVQRTGIRERRIADESEATSDLALRAAQQALERAGVEPGEIDFIVVGTTTGRHGVPHHRQHPPAPPGLPERGLDRPLRGVRGLRLQPLGGSAVHPDREVPHRALRGRGVPLAHHRLHRPRHVHPPRRRGGGGGAAAPPRTSPASSTPTSTRTAGTGSSSTSRAAARGTPRPTRRWTSGCTTPR